MTQAESRPRLSAKVSAEPTKGASWRRNERTILSCVRTLAPFASQAGTSRPKAKRLIVFSRRYAPKNTIRLPSCSGEADN